MKIVTMMNLRRMNCHWITGAAAMSDSNSLWVESIRTPLLVMLVGLLIMSALGMPISLPQGVGLVNHLVLMDLTNSIKESSKLKA